MIYVEMAGRCGNQLFHYSIARYVQLVTGDKLCLNFNHIFDKKAPEKGYIDYLKDFNVADYQYYNRPGNILKNESSFTQKILIGLKGIQLYCEKNKSRQYKANKAQFGEKILNFSGVYWVREGVTDITPFKRKKSLVSGVCETSLIYKIQDTLQKEIVPKKPVSPKNLELIKQIDNSNSVCVSVRRGDFFSKQNKKSFGVCTPNYYIKAKKFFDDRNIDNTMFFCFSDDIEWCKENLNFEGANVVYVSQDMPVYETLRLMYHCKHFILSNSTFSWWGQFLSKNNNKIVVSPSRWNNDGYDSNLINKDWVLIDD